MRIREIKWSDEDARELLQNFKSNLEKSNKTFRYFDKREFSIIQNHVYTIVMIEDEKVIGYAHLDKDGDTIWLGIALIEGYTGRGLGKVLMGSLMEYIRKNGIREIFLTVDSNNTIGINLYEKYGFKVVIEVNDYKKYYWRQENENRDLC